MQYKISLAFALLIASSEKAVVNSKSDGSLFVSSVKLARTDFKLSTVTVY
jgi:hypothetical protein